MLMRFREFYPNYPNLSRHWCPLSQRYAGVDALLSRLDNGWKIWGDIDFDEYWFGESRHTLVYHFMLIKQDNRVTIHVLHNPVLDRLLTQLCEKPISASGIVDEPGIDAVNYLCEQAPASKASVKRFSLLNVVG